MIKKMQGFYYLSVKMSLCLLWQIKKQLRLIFIRAGFELEKAAAFRAHTHTRCVLHLKLNPI